MIYVNNQTVLLFCFFWLGIISEANPSTTQLLTDPETLVSSNSVFKLGFFSLGNSSNRYVGIWYTNTDPDGKLEVVWVANRENPLTDASGVFKISDDGNLLVLNGQNKTFWSSNVPSYNSSKSFIRLLDTGNLVLLSNASVNTIWQSFDYPTDVFLPGMTFAIDSTLTEKKTLFRSWKNPSAPSSGNFAVGITTRNPPQVLLWDDNRPFWRNGPWNGNFFVGMKSVLSIVTDNSGKIYFGFSLANKGVGLLHFVVNYNGSLVERDWNNGSKKWENVWNARETECDVYGECGPFGSCKVINSPVCGCLRGFVPENDTEWRKGNWSGGCVRRKLLQCGNIGGKEDGFWEVKNVKVPDDAEWSSAVTKDDCRSQCLGTCSCLAYAYFSSIGCMSWNRSLIDIQEFTDYNRGIELSIRLANSELGTYNKQQRKPKVSFVKKNIGWIVPLVIVVLTIIAGITCLYRRYVKRARLGRPPSRLGRPPSMALKGDQSDSEFGDLPMFEFEKLVTATNNFQESNKLGQGGFGIVYKGKLEDGEEVAVKRLSKVSGQGLAEFMTEVLVISKLQHRNLVRLLGCCVEGEEKLLVYEYMPNKGLDALLFDQSQRELLAWETRFFIIQGVCRGILYLHRDSRLRIIHRDLKASNILLDNNLNPKISDFGMARIFGGNEDQANTNRVVGTYGYMSPEYAMEGRFSEKSDIFSFGVLLLEIVSGRRNGSFKDDDSLTLLGHAWRLWNKDEIMSLIDPTMTDSGMQDQILRCIQVALLCVQELPEDRPNISTVISMVESEVSLPHPMQPGFIQRSNAPKLHGKNMNVSVNRVSLSVIIGR